MIKAENLSDSFPHKELYNKISFTLEDDVHSVSYTHLTLPTKSKV